MEVGFVRIAKQAVHKLGRWYIGRICAAEAWQQSFRGHNERTIEYRFALAALGRFHPRTVLDVGTGTSAWPHLLSSCGYVVTAVDNIRDYWPQGMTNRHWQVLDIDIRNDDGLSEQFDAITCISVLEHIAEHRAAMRQMVQRLRPGGILVLTCPYSHRIYSPNVLTRPDNPYGKGLPFIVQSYSQAELNGWLDMGLEVENRELWRLFTGEVYGSGEKTPWQQVAEDKIHQLGCFVLRKPEGKAA
jgi:SAM-dependent methyltransferase